MSKSKKKSGEETATFVRQAVVSDAIPAMASDVSEHDWRQLRGWLEDLSLSFEPDIRDDQGLVGYRLFGRTWQVAVGLSLRLGQPRLHVTVLLCHGMERPEAGLLAVDRCNARLGLGQLLFVPGPPPQLSFFAATPFQLLDQEGFGRWFEAIHRELNEVAFAAVDRVQGYHPLDFEPLPNEESQEEQEVAAEPRQEPADSDRQAQPAPPLAHGRRKRAKPRRGGSEDA